MSNQTPLPNIVDVRKAVCTEGSELNTLYKKHKECIFDTSAVNSVPCLFPQMAETSRLNMTIDKPRGLDYWQVRCR
ncbi:hypothetical protein CEXT_455211 [Caerostris extrusa]|uniref:Uncharacterized protein n=1 Tax=Caerostris extrusa TaxID=172846 RepID=A0AAV4P989_CAEEX|nr:hypothetical protein CEXT_455211 [Caerostris extrusa]